MTLTNDGGGSPSNKLTFL